MRSILVLATCITVGFWLLLTGIAIVWYAGGGRWYSVQTASMEPVLKPGDAVMTRRIARGHVQLGSIVSFRDSAEPSVVITHRVISVSKQAATFTTKGDKLDQPDLPVANTRLLGEAVYVAPGLGTFVNWLRQPVGLIAMVYLPAIGVAAIEIRRLRNFAARVHYRVDY